MTCSKYTNMQGNMVYRDPVPCICQYSSDFTYPAPLAHGGYQILCPEFENYGYQIWHFKADNHTPICETEVLIIWVSHTLPRTFFSQLLLTMTIYTCLLLMNFLQGGFFL